MSADYFALDQEGVDSVRYALVLGLSAVAALDHFKASGHPGGAPHPFGGPQFGATAKIANALMLVESMLPAVPEHGGGA